MSAFLTPTILFTRWDRKAAVMGVLAAAVVLGLAERLEGNIAGAILSGIVGCVLGHLASRGEKEMPARGKESESG